MKNGLVISDTGPIFSLAVIDKLEILDEIFDKILIPKAVWIELNRDKTTVYFSKIETYFKNKVKKIKGLNELSFVMDYGESESVILYKETKADFLLSDDRKARKIAETLNINCTGTLAILSIAKEKGIIEYLKPLFEKFLSEKRYYSIDLLNRILDKYDEPIIIYKA